MFKVFFGVLLIHFIDWSPFLQPLFLPIPILKAKSPKGGLSALREGPLHRYPCPQLPQNPRCQGQLWSDYTLLFIFMY